MTKAYKSQHAMDAWIVSECPESEAFAQKTIEEIHTCNQDNIGGLDCHDMELLKNAYAVLYYAQMVSKNIAEKHASCSCGNIFAYPMPQNGASCAHTAMQSHGHAAKAMEGPSAVRA